MASVDRRLEALEQQAAEAFRRQHSSMGAACLDALERGSAEEVSELEDLAASIAERGEKPTPEEHPRFFELWEALLQRVSPGWAEEARIGRDLLRRELARLREEWTDAGRQRSTWLSDREYWLVCTAEANRSHALTRGAEAIADAGEAATVIAAIREPGTSTEETLRLVGW